MQWIFFENVSVQNQVLFRLVTLIRIIDLDAEFGTISYEDFSWNILVSNFTRIHLWDYERYSDRICTFFHSNRIFVHKISDWKNSPTKLFILCYESFRSETSSLNSLFNWFHVFFGNPKYVNFKMFRHCRIRILLRTFLHAKSMLVQ